MRPALTMPATTCHMLLCVGRCVRLRPSFGTSLIVVPVALLNKFLVGAIASFARSTCFVASRKNSWRHRSFKAMPKPRATSASTGASSRARWLRILP